MAAKAAIERAYNELASFVEREQARQDVNIHIFNCLMITIYLLNNNNQVSEMLFIVQS